MVGLRVVIAKPVSMMEKCIIATTLIAALGVVSYVAVVRFGLVNVLGKLQLALIPSVILGVLTVLFILLNRNCWMNNLESHATIAHFLTWILLILAFIIFDDPKTRLLVYLLWPIAPVTWYFSNIVRVKPCTEMLNTIMLGIHGGLGAYTLVLVTIRIMEWLRVTPILAQPAMIAQSIIPPDMIASAVGTGMVPFMLLLAAFIEESMFRLSLAVFSRFGTYTIAFLVSFLFIWLHTFTRMYLDPTTLLQVTTAIALANAVFIAVYTRTLCIWCSILSHTLYNILVITQAPLVPALAAEVMLALLHLYIKQKIK